MSQTVVKIGINKKLFEKRLELKLSRKEASEALGFSKFILTVLERGYLKCNDKYKEAFKRVYKIDDDFFDGSYDYPIVINEKVYEPLKINEKFEKASKSLKFRIGTGVGSLLFIGIMVAGLVINPKLTKSAASFFSQDVKDYHSYVVENGTQESKSDIFSIFATLVPDKIYYVSGDLEGSEFTYQNLRMYVFEKEKNMNLFFFDASFSVDVDSKKYSVYIEQRFTGEKEQKVHYLIQPIEEETTSSTYLRSTLYAKKDKDFKTSFKYDSVYDIEVDGSGSEQVKYGSDKYKLNQQVVEQTYDVFESDLDSIFTTEVTGKESTYKDFYLDYGKGVGTFNKRQNLATTLSFLGLALAIVSAALFVLSLLNEKHIEKKTMKFAKEVEVNQNLLTETVEQEEGKAVLPKNKWKNLFVPEFVMRILILVLLGASSIATYFLFMNVIKLNVSGINQSIGISGVLSSLTVVATMIVYFVKLDIYQNKKDYLGYSIFLFFGGLLYYLVVVFIFYTFQSAGVTSISDAIMKYLPGNFIWAILVVNLCTLLLFAPIKKNSDKKWKVYSVRLSAIIPFSYLVASSIISFGIQALGWSIPYAVSSLFMFKAPMITVFATVYILGVYIYRRFAKEKFGDTNGSIYITGNRYNYLRNIIAAGTILVIGVFDLICLFAWPENKMGFGTNYLMLVAIPFILFYHPHIGKRNKTWDTVYNILYGFVYVVGIVLIVFAVIKLLSTI